MDDTLSGDTELFYMFVNDKNSTKPKYIIFSTDARFHRGTRIPTMRITYITEKWGKEIIEKCRFCETFKKVEHRVYDEFRGKPN